MSKNNPLVSGGKSLNINTKTSSEKCPDKFKDSINNISIKARDFCDNAELNDNRFKSWTTPIFLVWDWAPQLPLNAFLKPSSTNNPFSLKNSM